jgi:hypothetical protein
MIHIMLVAHFHYVFKYGAVFALICRILLLGWRVILDLHIMEFWTSSFLCNIHRVNITFFQCIC